MRHGGQGRSKHIWACVTGQRLRGLGATPDPAKIPTAHPVAVGASSYLIDPAEVPPRWWFCLTRQRRRRWSERNQRQETARFVRVVKLSQEDTPDRAPAATSPQKGRYRIEKELMPSEWDKVTGK